MQPGTKTGPPTARVEDRSPATKNGPLKIAVMGAGAVGCWIGGKLALAGHDVAFVARGRTKAELAEHGMTLVELDGRRSTLARERLKLHEATDLADRDIVLLCVKSKDTKEVGATLSQTTGSGTLVVSFQNGLRNPDVLREVVGDRPVSGGIVGFNVVCPAPAEFKQGTSGPLVIERGDPRAEALALALRGAGLQTELASDIRSAQWAKLVMNLNNALSALSSVPTSQLVIEPGYRRLIRALSAEALDVMRAAGVRPGKVGPIPVTWFPTVLGLPTPLLRLAVAGPLVKIDPGARSSMWEDLARGRPTEVDDLNGEVVRLAASCGARAPLNARIVELVHEVEAAGAGSPKWSADELWTRLHASGGAVSAARP